MKGEPYRAKPLTWKQKLLETGIVIASIPVSWVLLESFYPAELISDIWKGKILIVATILSHPPHLIWLYIHEKYGKIGFGSALIGNVLRLLGLFAISVTLFMRSPEYLREGVLAYLIVVATFFGFKVASLVVRIIYAR